MTEQKANAIIQECRQHILIMSKLADDKDLICNQIKVINEMARFSLAVQMTLGQMDIPAESHGAIIEAGSRIPSGEQVEQLRSTLKT